MNKDDKALRYIYLIEFPNGKAYCGKRTCQAKTIQEDIYYGSGKYVTNYIGKHGVNELRKIILVCGYFTVDEINKFEINCIKNIRERYGKDCMNFADGGEGGNLHAFIKHDKNYKEIHSKAEKKVWDELKKNPEAYEARCDKNRQGTIKAYEQGKLDPYGIMKFRTEHPIKFKRSMKGKKSSIKGKISITNGKINKYINIEDKIPEGWRKGLTKADTSGTKGMKWFNNGKIEKCGKRCPKGFKPGRLNKSVKDKICINDGKRNRFITKDTEIPKGWHKGMINNHKK